MLRNSARPRSIGFEPFSGSGTTLLAADALGLPCRAMEMDPRYVDAAIIRWKRATGLQATLGVGGLGIDELGETRASR